MQRDGRYLLVTNDWQLGPQRMLELYRSKDALEKRFEVAKQDLRIRPLYVHSDARIRALLLVNMLALLAYSLLERQVQQAGLHLTTRRIVEQLEGVTVIETHCHDGSVLRRLTPLSAEQDALLTILAALLAQSRSAISYQPCRRRLSQPPCYYSYHRRPPWLERSPNRPVHPGTGQPCPGGSDLPLHCPNRRHRGLRTGVEPSRTVLPTSPTAKTALYSFVKVRNLG